MNAIIMPRYCANFFKVITNGLKPIHRRAPRDHLDFFCWSFLSLASQLLSKSWLCYALELIYLKLYYHKLSAPSGAITHYTTRENMQAWGLSHPNHVAIAHHCQRNHTLGGQLLLSRICFQARFDKLCSRHRGKDYPGQLLASITPIYFD